MLFAVGDLVFDTTVHRSLAARTAKKSILLAKHTTAGWERHFL